MLEGISWTHFGAVVGAGAGLWYAYVLLKGRAGGQAKQIAGPAAATKPPAAKRTWGVVSENTAPAPAPASDQQAGEESLDSRHFQALEELADDLQQIIETHGPTGGKDALLEKLRQEIARYPELGKAAFRSAITNLVIRAAQTECNITLSRQEAEQLWENI
jgi:hypothetical protein